MLNPFSAAHHHNLFLYWNSEFSKLSTTSPSACLWTLLFFLFVEGGGFSPTFAEELLSTLYLLGFIIKIRQLWWPKIMPNNVDSIIANEALQETSALPCSPRLVVQFFSAPWLLTTTKRLVIKTFLRICLFITKFIILKSSYRHVLCKLCALTV